MTELMKSLVGLLPAGSLIVLVPGEELSDASTHGTQPRFPANPADDGGLSATEHSDSALTLRDWGLRLPGASVRELQRAAENGALEARIREKGKGHGAVVATPEAVERYLSTCAAIQNGAIPRPSWWAKVRKGAGARIHA